MTRSIVFIYPKINTLTDRALQPAQHTAASRLGPAIQIYATIHFAAVRRQPLVSSISGKGDQYKKLLQDVNNRKRAYKLPFVSESVANHCKIIVIT